MNKLTEAIQAIVKEQFPHANLEKVEIDSDEDAYGDPILRITLVFESVKALDPNATGAFVRKLRPKISGDSFPLVNYINSTEYRQLHPAFA